MASSIGNRREVGAFSELDPVRVPTEQLQHDWEARIGRLLEAIEDRLPGVAGLADFVAPRLDEAPEHCAESRAERLDVQDDVQVLRGPELEAGRFHRESGGVPPISTNWSAWPAKYSRNTSSPFTTESAPQFIQRELNTLVGVALQAERQGKRIDGFAVGTSAGL